MDSPAGQRLLILSFFVLWLGTLAFWIWTLVDAIRVPDDSQYKSGTKLVWVLVIVLASLIGSIIYVAIGRPEGGASGAIARWGTHPTPPRQPGYGAGVPPPPLPPPARS
ncbi:MAG: PLDc N-terminal domain-containing protein [Actinomycetota bacterium]